jgi:hypothetical protein
LSCGSQYLLIEEIPSAMNAMGFLDGGFGLIANENPPAESGPIILSICDHDNYDRRVVHVDEEDGRVEVVRTMHRHNSHTSAATRVSAYGRAVAS